MSVSAAPCTTSPIEGRTRRPTLAIAVGALMVVDLVGGLLAITSEVNTVGEAWGGEALLAAPLPFMLGQVALTVAACRWEDRRGIAAAVVLALASLVSIASGFFDGGLGNDDLTPGLQTYQVFLLFVTGVVGVLAALRACRIAVARVQR